MSINLFTINTDNYISNDPLILISWYIHKFGKPSFGMNGSNFYHLYRSLQLLRDSLLKNPSKKYFNNWKIKIKLVFNLLVCLKFQLKVHRLKIQRNILLNYFHYLETPAIKDTCKDCEEENKNFHFKFFLLKVVQNFITNWIVKW